MDRKLEACIHSGEINHFFFTMNEQEALSLLVAFFEENHIAHYISLKKYKIRAMIFSLVDYCQCSISFHIGCCIHFFCIAGSRDLFWDTVQKLCNVLQIDKMRFSRPPPLTMSRSLSTKKEEQMHSWITICENLAYDTCAQDLQYQYAQTLVLLLPSVIETLPLDGISFAAMVALLQSNDPQIVRLVCFLIQQIPLTKVTKLEIDDILSKQVEQWKAYYHLPKTYFRIQFILEEMIKTIHS